MLRTLLSVILLLPLAASPHGGMTPPHDAAPPQNQAPQTVDYIDVGTLYVGGSSATVNATSYFSDTAGDILTYSVNSPTPTVATVSISGSTVTISPVGVGTTGRIIVTAEDLGGLTNTQDFTVTVQNPPSNRAPQTVGSISNLTLQTGGSAASITVSSYFSDPDDDTLTYTVNSPNPGIVTVSILGSTVTVTPVGVGTTGKIIVTARDPDGFTATQDFTATVSAPPPPANRVPQEVGSISNLTLQTGGSAATINVSSYFSDPDDDTLTYSANSPSPSVVTVSILGSTVTVTPAGVGTTGKIVVTATDPGGLSASQDFTATVEDPPPPENNAPVADGEIGDITLSKGGSSTTIGVSNKFSDPDEDTLTYSVNNPSPNIATVSISGSTVTIAPVSTGATAKIIVTATDPGGLTATQDFTATVTNQPPRPVGTINSISIPKNGASRSVTVSRYFSDPNGDALTFSAASSNTGVATATASGGSVEITSKATGTATITVTATDTDDATGTQIIGVTVTNTPPQPLGAIATMTFHRGQAAKSTEVSDNFSDPDRDETLTYSATSSNASVATVSVVGSRVRVDPGGLGTARISLTATDSEGRSASHGFNVEVVNRPPVVSQGISARTLNKNSSTSISASSHFSDPDGDQMTYSATSSNTNIVAAGASGSTVTIESEDDGGNATVTVTATDAHNGFVSVDFTVTVRNRAPQTSGSISAVTLYKNRHTQDVDVSGKFTDPDGDDLTYSASSSNTNVATASVTSNTVTITSGRSGSATVTVTARDNDNAYATQLISVTSSNRAPQVVDSIADVNIRVGDTPKSIEVSSKFTDPDTDNLTFSVDNPSSSIAAVSISGSVVEVDPRSEGQIGKVTVTATDTERVSISLDFRVVVSPEQTLSCPTANTVPVTVPSISAGGDSVTVDVSAYFTIPEGVTPTFSVNDPSPSTATVSISGHTLTIQPITQGDTGKVIVTATSTGCTDVTRDFNVTVGPPEVTQTPSCPTVNTDTVPVPELSAGGDPAKLDISAYFTIPDGVTPSYSVNNPNPGVAAVSISGDTLTIQPITQGHTGKIIVTAASTGCTGVDRELFNLQIGAPEATQTPSCPTANTDPVEVPFMCAGGNPVTMDVSDFFTIPEGVTPTYSVNNPNSTIADVSISGHTLTIQPIAQGHTGKVIVTASATGCTGVIRDFNVSVDPVPPTAECPAVKQMHPSRDLSLVVDGSDVDVDLNSHFTNLSRSNVNYTIVSSDTGVATASRTSTTLAISPGIAGTAQVTVTVSRCGCGTGVSQVFNVTVSEAVIPPPPVACPEPMNTIPALEFAVGGDAASIVVSGYFRLPDGFTPEYAISSSDASIATASMSGDTLTISPVAAGTDTITVTVSINNADASCANVAQTINVTVSEAVIPPPPVACPEPMNTIPALELAVGGDAASIVVSGYFRLPDGFTPEYAISSSDASIATASMSGDTLTISPVAAGTDTVTVSITNADTTCGVVAQSIVVTVRPTCPAAVMDASVPDQMLYTIGGAATIDLTKFFEQVDQDGTTISVTSPDPAIAKVSLDGTTITIDPVSEGTIDAVEITISKTGCDPLTDPFMVTVKDPFSAIWSVSAEGDVYRIEGNVGNGLLNPDQKLVVDGKIKAEEVYLSMIPADYVFEEDYPLMPLEDVAEHIEARGHLPGVAPGAEMKSGGIGISRMQTLLLEKIEELSLYIITQHEQLVSQGDHIASQQRRLELRAQRISQLENRLERLER